MTEPNMNAKIEATVLDRDFVKPNDVTKRTTVNKMLPIRTPPCNRRRRMGKSENIWIENRVSANTDMSSTSRDARTTDEEIAAFMDKTEVKRSRPCPPLDSPL